MWVAGNFIWGLLHNSKCKLFFYPFIKGLNCTVIVCVCVCLSMLWYQICHNDFHKCGWVCERKIERENCKEKCTQTRQMKRTMFLVVGGIGFETAFAYTSFEWCVYTAHTMRRNRRTVQFIGLPSRCNAFVMQSNGFQCTWERVRERLNACKLVNNNSKWATREKTFSNWFSQWIIVTMPTRIHTHTVRGQFDFGGFSWLNIQRFV